VTVPTDDTVPLAVRGDWPEGEEFVCHVLAQVSVGGAPLGLVAVDTETPSPLPDHFIRVSTLSGRGGPDRQGTTSTFPFIVETFAPNRRQSKAMMRQATNLLLGLDRGGSYMGILVDACYQTAADVAEPEPDDTDKVTDSTWVIEWRRHRGPDVMPLEVGP
jgi:hypothetical protein